MNIREFWDAVLRQDADEIREYFHPGAWVNWHNTNEHSGSLQDSRLEIIQVRILPG